MRVLAAASALLLVSLALGCKTKSPPAAGAGSGSAAAAAPGSGGSGGSAGGGSGGAGSAAPAAPEADLDSKEIMARAEAAPEVWVRHVMIGWKALEPTFTAQGGKLNERAAARDNNAAAALTKEVLAQCTAKPEAVGELSDKYSEDPNAVSGDAYHVTPTTGMPPPFVQLALRLKEHEAGVVRTPFGYHVVVRVPKPAPDPLESADILKRPETSDRVWVRHILIGWDRRPANTDPRARARTKEAADKLAKELLGQVRANADIVKLMKTHSEDPGSGKSGDAYEVDRSMVPEFRNLAMRLKLGETGLARTAFGWHVIKRVPEPPPPPPPGPDKLDSADILGRKDVAAKVKVKHILVGWDEVNAGDARALKRTRADLEKLVGEIVAKAKGGEKFEALMIAHSEDNPEAVKQGNSYDVSPDAQLVPTFKNLSLRLKVGEVGVVKSDYGIHVIKRVE